MFKKLIITAHLMLFGATNCYAFKNYLTVAESFGGGTVFCVSDTEEDVKFCDTREGAKGRYGLIVANKDQTQFNGGVMWSADISSIGIGAQSRDNGSSNTEAITNARLDEDINSNAAWLCRNNRDGDYDGWYLPAISELHRLYIYAMTNNLVGDKCTSGERCFLGNGYWSSTEGALARYSDLASVFFFRDRFMGGEIKNVRFSVRAIRSFGPLDFQSPIFLETKTAYNVGMKPGQKNSILKKYNNKVKNTLGTLEKLGETLWSIDNGE